MFSAKVKALAPWSQMQTATYFLLRQRICGLFTLTQKPVVGCVAPKKGALC